MNGFARLCMLPAGGGHSFSPSRSAAQSLTRRRPPGGGAVGGEACPWLPWSRRRVRRLGRRGLARPSPWMTIGDSFSVCPGDRPSRRGWRRRFSRSRSPGDVCYGKACWLRFGAPVIGVPAGWRATSVRRYPCQTALGYWRTRSTRMADRSSRRANRQGAHPGAPFRRRAGRQACLGGGRRISMGPARSAAQATLRPI